MTYPKPPVLKTYSEEVKVEAGRRLKTIYRNTNNVADWLIEVNFLHLCARVEKEINNARKEG